MKKKQIKSLKLNKKSISTLSTTDAIKGGTIPTFGIICTVTRVSIDICTQWEGCDVPTIGHDDGSLCVSRDANWCNGR